MATHSNVLRGRDSELLSIRNMLASATRGTGSHVIAWGGAGSGKSALLSAAGSLGRNQDFVVMQARGTYAEHRRPFTIARRLFESCRAQIDPDPVMRLLDSLPKEARDALTATDQLQDYSERLHRDLDVLDTALAQTANQGRPLLIVVDNVHWADHQSMCWLATLAERVEYLPVALLTSICGGIPGTDPHLLDELRVTSQQQLRLGRLGFSDTAAVLEERLEAPAVDETFVAACLRETDGNPLLLTELARQIRDSASALTPEAVGRQAESPSETLAMAIKVRLRRISPNALSMLRAVAVLDGQATHERVAALSAVTLAEAITGCQAMTQLGLLAAAPPQVRVAQPLLRTAIMREHAYTALQAVHEQAAKLLQADGESDATVAEQLLASGPLNEPWVPGMLRSAAQSALAEGDPHTAGLYLRRVLTESLPADERMAVLIDLAAVSSRTDLAETSRNLSRAAALAPPGTVHRLIRPDDFVLLILSGRTDQAAAIFGEISADPSGRSRSPLETRWRLLTEAHSPDAVRGLLSELREESGGGALAFGIAALVESLAACSADSHGPNECPDAPQADGSHQRLGARAITLHLARKASGIYPSTAESVAGHLFAAAALALAGELGGARALCQSALSAAQRWQHLPLQALGLIVRAAITLGLGRRSDALQDARAANDLLSRSGVKRGSLLSDLCLTFLLLASVDAEGHAETLAVLEQADLSGSPASGVRLGYLLLARGRLRLAAGYPEEAVEDLLASGELLTQHCVNNPAAAPWRSAAAEALLLCGRDAEARSYAVQEVALAREWGSAVHLGAALRVQAAVSPGLDQLALLEESVGLLGATDAKPEQARTLLSLGRLLAQREELTRARQVLREALELAESVGQHQEVAIAKRELLAAGGRTRRAPRDGLASLTGSELKVAKLALAGKTNREIATILFVQQRTVEIHLTNTYRKLNVEGRDQLTTVFKAESGTTIPD